jgi:hypothetical protein
MSADSSQCSPFASRTVTRHLLRGGAGLSLLAVALLLLDTHPVGAIGLAVAAVVALRGCPMCWTIGLIETITHRVRSLATKRPS